MTTPLSVDLRTSTAQAHEAAEHSVFVARLLAGEGSIGDFTLLTAQLLPVYEALEAAVARHASHPYVAAVHDEALARAPHLAADLAVLAADGPLPTLAATAGYVDRLAGLAAPEQILAHHYVRYLGDLSGGQVVARLAARHYDIPEEALSFYRFEGIGKLKSYKDGYRQRLDALDLDAAARRRVVDEAVRAFELNRAVFVELAEVSPGVPAGVAAAG